MKKYHLLLTVLFIAINAITAFAQKDTTTASKIDEYLQPYLDMDAWSGLISIYKHGEPIFQKAYGYADREWKIPNTKDTKFRIASISKLFTEVAILKLVEEDAISLSDPLSKFIIDYPRGTEITIRQLLNHRAGIPHLNNFPNYNDLIKYDYDINEIIELFKNKPLDYDPGERYRYSNSGYVLLAYIIEKVSQATYGDYLQKEILNPLGLANTGIDNNSEILQKRANGYMFNSSGDLVNADFVNMSIKIGGGSMYSTAGDLNLFLQGLFRKKVIDSTLNELPNFIEIEGEQAFQASGRVQGFCHQITHRFSSELTVMVLGNHYSNLALPISDDIYNIYTGKPYSIPENYLSQETQLPVEELKVYEGNYDFGFGPIRKLKVKGNSLTYGALDLESADALIPLGGNRFFYIQYWVILEFSDMENGRFKTLEWVMGKNRFPANRVIN
ncbi:serine hydrolase domain-containing protein [Muriicola soli]|uniref:Class A beta-lactamase-related serine hydrolase n=1 Tax=Muriicola soli TaxID=2507538 RepID=A0A411E8Z6_9FLAO|nr:serine hydrolase domain-containing protein [Muriicola soli]QBA64004.1 class A beta-lactamase-related serine hydrolase [Muriicola soli]